MTTLTDGRKDEIAALLAGLIDLSAAAQQAEPGEVPEKGQLYDSLLASVKGGQDTQLDKQALAAKIASVYGTKGVFIESLKAFGETVQVAGGALKALLNSGQIGEDEAQAYLQAEFPQYQFNGVDFGDRSAKSLEVKAATAEAAAALADPEARRTLTEVRLEQARLQAGDVPQNPTERPPVNPAVRLPSFTEEYSASQVYGAVRVAMDDVQSYLSRAFNGEIRYGTGVVPGSAIRPGSMALNRIDFADMALIRRIVPGPEQAISLDTVLDENADRWVRESGGIAGPGRIRRVTSRTYPELGNFDQRPGAGPQRYRIVIPNMRFTIMSMRWTSGPASTPPTGADELEVAYGFVLRDIPHFLSRPPHEILYASVQGSPPSAMSRVHQGGSTLMQTRAQDFYNAPTRWSTFGASAYVPASSYLDTLKGIGFSLLTGQTAQEVHGQVNGHESQSFAYVRGDGTGPTASVPDGLSVPPLTVGSVSGANAGGGGGYTSTNFWHDTAAANRDLEQEAGADASNLVTEGVPYLYEDCARLAATNETFSLAVQVLPTYKLSGASVTSFVQSSGADERVSRWYQNGLEPVDADGLEWSIDVVVV